MPKHDEWTTAYRDWEHGAAEELAKIDPDLGRLFLACPMPLGRERLDAQLAMLSACDAGLRGSEIPAAAVFKQNLDVAREGWGF